MPAKTAPKKAPAKPARKATRSKAPAKPRPAKAAPKPGPAPAEVARLRRGGATWQQVREQFGVKTSSGAFTARLNAAGYDAAGLKLDGSGPRESKARVKKAA
jgi:hypothetical protein